jgi:5-methylcytosine-specific restriction enzyme subunit McrC
MSPAVELEEWRKTTFETYPQLRGFFLSDDSATQQLVSALIGEEDGTQGLSRKKRLGIAQLRQGLVLEATSFVGRIMLEQVQVTIRPKIKMMPLLHLLQYAYELRQLDLFTAVHFEVESFSFQDLLIYQLEQEVRDLLVHGLHRAYSRREAVLNAPRGRLDVQGLVGRGGLIQGDLPCVYYTRLEDHLLNQVILAGVHLGIAMTSSEGLRRRLENLAHIHLAGITSLKLTAHHLKLARHKLSRLSALYVPVLTLVELLLASKGVSIREEQQELALPGFLFDMNQFFQDLLQRFLQEYLPEQEVLAQYEISHLLNYRENPRKRRSPELRPDYVVKQQGRVVAILDAKYRDLWEQDLPPQMLYQLVMYALSQADCNHATILYPVTEAMASPSQIEVSFPGQKPGYVILRPVNLLYLEELLTQKYQTDNEKECKKFAQWLVFGDRREGKIGE